MGAMVRDTLSDLLRNVRLRGAAFFYMGFRGQWSAQGHAVAQIAQSPMAGCDHVMDYHMITKGHGWAAVDGAEPVQLSPGDVVMFPQGDRYVISGAPGLPPMPAECESLSTRQDDAQPVTAPHMGGMRIRGALAHEDEADAILACGFLGCDLRPVRALISALPRVLHLPAERAGNWVSHVIDQAVTESNQRRPGGDAVLERLSEMMFVDAARRYLESLPEDAVGWLAGLRDRFVGRALGLLHERPEHAWTVDELAREVGLSRSALHERFVQYLGQPPMQYLASWRIQVGARLLRESHRNVVDIALDVGYESEAAFSRAFRRLMGAPPAAWRRAQV